MSCAYLPRCNTYMSTLFTVLQHIIVCICKFISDPGVPGLAPSKYVEFQLHNNGVLLLETLKTVSYSVFRLLLLRSAA